MGTDQSTSVALEKKVVDFVSKRNDAEKAPEKGVVVENPLEKTTDKL